MCCSLSSGGVCVSNLLPYLIRIINSISYFYETGVNDPQSRSSDERACCAKHPRLHDHLIPSRLYDLLMQDSVFVWRNPLQPLESTGKGCSIVHADFFHNVLHAHIGKQHLLGIFYPDIHQIF